MTFAALAATPTADEYEEMQEDTAECEYEDEMPDDATAGVPDDLSDLTALLSESVTIADARKATKTAARKGAKIDPALANIARTADEALSWSPECAVARFIESHCACGASHRRFDGWFIVSRHRREAGASRFTRAEDHCSLPSWQYTALETTLYCSDCVEAEALPVASIDTLTGIDALGAAPSPYGEQLPLSLHAVLHLEI